MKIKIEISKKIIANVLESCFSISHSKELLLEQLILSNTYIKNHLKLKYSDKNTVKITLKPDEAVALFRICISVKNEYLDAISVDIQQQLGAHGIELPFVHYPITII